MKTREVTFYSEGTKMIGTIYLPDDYKEGEKRPRKLRMDRTQQSISGHVCPPDDKVRICVHGL